MSDRLKNISVPDSLDHAVEIADRVWWVGHYLENDVFQCHCYLIEQGNQSVLIDPGSKLTFEKTLGKIREVVPFESIRYFICQHQDPDIAAAMPAIDDMVSRDDAVLVTHWRTKMLLKHYDLKLPFWLIDTHDWQLPLEDRTLKFVMTPYAHFPGAFCTLDQLTEVLFSSDLFGSFSDYHRFIAEDEDHFEVIRPFHEHYIPSREVLNHALSEIEMLPVKLIAPQHGSLIPAPLIEPIIRRLKELECGLYLLSRGDTNIRDLSRLNQTLQQITETIILSRDFRDTANRLVEVIRQNLPVASLEFYAQSGGDRVLHFSPERRYRGLEVKPDERVAEVLGEGRYQWLETVLHWGGQPSDYCLINGADGPDLYVPLFSPEGEIARSLVIMHLSEAVTMTGHLDQVISQLTLPLQVAVEREVMYRVMDMEREKIYQRSIKDPLTGLFTRIYMQDVVQRLCEIQDREQDYQVSAVMLDIDHFKSINDRFGHGIGDQVLQKVSGIIQDSIRDSDMPVRFGGEEIIIFTAGKNCAQISLMAERLRMAVESLLFEELEQTVSVTISLGTAMRRSGEPLSGLIERADRALYQAKNSGRNRVVNGENCTGEGIR